MSRAIAQRTAQTRDLCALRQGAADHHNVTSTSKRVRLTFGGGGVDIQARMSHVLRVQLEVIVYMFPIRRQEI